MNIFNYIIQLGASVMMPVIFTIIGLCIGMRFGSDASDFVNGHILYVDGGILAYIGKQP